MAAEIVDLRRAKLDRMNTEELFVHIEQHLGKLQDWTIRREMNWLETLRNSPYEENARKLMLEHLLEMEFADPDALNLLSRDEMVAMVDASYLRYRTLQLQLLKKRYGEHPTLKEFSLIKSV